MWSDDVAERFTAMPAVGSTTEHRGDDGGEEWDRPEGSKTLGNAVMLPPPLAASAAWEGATTCDEFGKLGDASFPEGKP